jgi:RNA polymerase sigma-70 factor, ECF subfamily
LSNFKRKIHEIENKNLAFLENYDTVGGMFHLDESTLKQLKAKNEQVFHVFYTKTVKIFFRYIRSKSYLSEAQTEDLVSELYVKIWNNLDNYKIEHSFETRCRTILRNMMTDHFRKTKEEQLSEYESSEHHFEDTILDITENNRSYERIQQALSQLDELSAEIIHLKFIEEQSYEEISSTLNISQETIRQRLSRGLKKIKELLAV